MLLYFFIGQEFGRFGILVSALYVIFGAIRLARFNISTAKTDPNVFLSLWILLFNKYTRKLQSHTSFSCTWRLCADGK
jgi:CDP-diacylglycerol--serine O-phosphatidyltransferase